MLACIISLRPLTIPPTILSVLCYIALRDELHQLEKRLQQQKLALKTAEEEEEEVGYCLWNVLMAVWFLLIFSYSGPLLLHHWYISYITYFRCNVSLQATRSARLRQQQRVEEESLQKEQHQKEVEQYENRIKMAETALKQQQIEHKEKLGLKKRQYEVCPVDKLVL